MKNNPYWVANEMNHGMKKQRYMANASLKYEILDWLDVTGRVRIDNATNDYSDKRNASTDLYFTNSSIYGFYKYYKADDRQAYADVMANINKRFGDLSLSANIGGSFTQTYYAPKADLTIIQGEMERVIPEINRLAAEQEKAGKKVGVICTDETREQYTTGDIKSIGLRAEDETIAHHLFAILRDFDEDGVEVIYSEAFDTPRMGQAIMNRLLKAAGHKVAEV
jgi:hypothetical protein